jgi:aspartyl-tRNA(Asn)/glutamyl-tRNA(Gln) amidotransferase subunit C
LERRVKVTEQDVEYVAGLANLDLTAAERLRMRTDLNAILEYIDQLSAVETSNVEPMAQVAQIATAIDTRESGLRADERRECLPREAALANAPQSDGTFFRVPKVIER